MINGTIFDLIALNARAIIPDLAGGDRIAGGSTPEKI